MATQTFDFRNLGVPDINTGVPIGRGFLHRLNYRASVNILPADRMHVFGRVPSDEHWYILQWSVDDRTALGNVPNEWKTLSLWVQSSYFESPFAVNDVKPDGPWKEETSGAYGLVWSRWWDTVTRVAWSDYANSGYPFRSKFIVRCTDPVFSFCRWPAGTNFVFQSYYPLVASGSLLSLLTELLVVRFRTEDQDFRRLSREEGKDFILQDVHMQQHRPILGQ